jgi:VWFA-related protein
VICLGVAGVAADAQSFRARVDVVQVTVTVTDAEGRLARGLAAADFEIFEDGVEQPITQFSDARVPVSLGVLLDASDSMRGGAAEDASAALGRFVRDLLLPVDEVFVATFNHRPRLAAVWTTPPRALGDALADLVPGGGTAIYDALADTARLFDRRSHLRAALVVISDGADTASGRTLQEALEELRRSDAFVYAVAIDSPDALESTRVNPAALQEVAGLTGGYTEVVRSAADLGPATSRIAEELNSQYTLGYNAPRPPDGSWRAIRVRVRGGAYTARARRGYYAAPSTSPAR